MRRRESLVQIHVDDVKAHIAGADFAKNRIKVSAVVVEQAARLVHHLRDLFDFALKDTQG